MRVYLRAVVCVQLSTGASLGARCGESAQARSVTDAPVVGRGLFTKLVVDPGYMAFLTASGLDAMDGEPRAHFAASHPMHLPRPLAAPQRPAQWILLSMRQHGAFGRRHRLRGQRPALVRWRCLGYGRRLLAGLDLPCGEPPAKTTVGRGTCSGESVISNGTCLPLCTMCAAIRWPRRRARVVQWHAQSGSVG